MPNFRKPVMIGNVVLPSDVERNTYVPYALKTNTVCVVTDDGDFIKNAPVVLNFCGHNDGWFTSMEFPPNDTTLGTQVVLLSIRHHDTPMVIGCLQPRQTVTAINEEYQFSISRKYQEIDDNENVINESSAIIEGKGLKGILNILVNNKDGSGGKINITSKNGQESGEICLRTNNLKIYGNKTVNILSDELVTINVGFVDGSDTVQHKIEIDQGKISLLHNEEHKIDITEDEILLEHSDGKKVQVTDSDVKFNGGNNGGLVVVSDLVSRLNEIENSHNGLVLTFNTHLHTVSTAGTPVAHTGTAAPPTTSSSDTIAPITFSTDFENTDVNH